MPISEISRDELPLVLRVEDIQRVLRVSRMTAYELMHRHGFPVVRLGRTFRVPRDAFLRWIDAQAGVGVGVPDEA